MLKYEVLMSGEFITYMYKKFVRTTIFEAINETILFVECTNFNIL